MSVYSTSKRKDNLSVQLRTYKPVAWLFALVMASALALVWTTQAKAAHPGSNGIMVFASTRDGDNEIYTMNTDGTSVTKITDNTYNDRKPSVGPGGEKIAFVSNRDGNDEIYLAEENGASVTRLTNNSASDLNPTWSNNGEEVAFERTVTGQDSEIMSVNSDIPEGSLDDPDTDTDPNTSPTVAEVRQLTNNTVDDMRPTWAPNGDLLFDRDPIVGSGGTDSIVKMTNTSTQAETVITSTVDEWDPDVSPDGTKITYVQGEGNNADIRYMNYDGTGRTNVATATNDEEKPAYSPDGTFITYTRTNSGQAEVYKKVLSTGTVTNLSNNAAEDNNSEVRPVVSGTQTTITSVAVTPDSSTPPSTEDAVVTFEHAESYLGAASFECRIDGGSWSTCTSPKTYTGLTFGAEHTVEVRATVGGVTETTPASDTWQSGYSADAPPIGALLPQWFGLDGLLGNLLSSIGLVDLHDTASFQHAHAGLNTQGSAMCWPDCNHYEAGNASYLQSDGVVDSNITACSAPQDNRDAYSVAYDAQTNRTHKAVAGYGCNTTFTNINHEKHKLKVRNLQCYYGNFPCFWEWITGWSYH